MRVLAAGGDRAAGGSLTAEGSLAAERGYLAETSNLLFHLALVGLLIAILYRQLWDARFDELDNVVDRSAREIFRAAAADRIETFHRQADEPAMIG